MFALLLGCSTRDTPLVFAAASTGPALQEALEELGLEARVHLASSAALARQIEAGADAAVLLSAHPSCVDELDVQARRNLLENGIVLAGEPGAQLSGARCIATGDPEHVPLGVYAREALTEQDRWDALEPRIIGTADAAAASALVRRGECELGWIYSTDVGELTVHERLDGRATYVLARLTYEGADLYDRLPTAGSWARAGFEVLP